MGRLRSRHGRFALLPVPPRERVKILASTVADFLRLHPTPLVPSCDQIACG
jgi:hypothetical protein